VKIDCIPRLKELSLALSEKDAEGSPFAAITFEGTNPNPVFTPNTYMPKKGTDGNAITTYYRYAVKDEVCGDFFLWFAGFLAIESRPRLHLVTVVWILDLLTGNHRPTRPRRRA